MLSLLVAAIALVHPAHQAHPAKRVGFYSLLLWRLGAGRVGQHRQDIAQPHALNVLPKLKGKATQQPQLV